MEFLANITGEFAMAEDEAQMTAKKKKNPNPLLPLPTQLKQTSPRQTSQHLPRDFPPSLEIYLRRSFKNCAKE